MVLAPTLVNVKLLPPSLITPFKVRVPAPPIDALLPKVMLLLRVSVVAVPVSAPAAATPVPFKVMVLVLANVAVAKFISSAAPVAATVVLLDCVAPDPKPFAFVIDKVPTLISVAPV